mmetsp:Transcript_65201/g.180874  ORF Transcript_65201/g.180874 Transcript_65201/m.180874 type:complete len:224 (+) Transcript_65201:299-970(+)
MEQDGKGEDVGRRAIEVTRQDLGRHVGQCAGPLGVELRVVIGALRAPQVAQLHGWQCNALTIWHDNVGQEDIGCLDVPVHDMPGVQMRNRVGNLEAGLQPLRQAHRLRRDLCCSMQQLRERTAEAKLQNEGRRIMTIDPEDAQELDNVGMLSLAQGLCLAQSLFGDPGLDALHGNLSLHAVNIASVYLAETALANVRDRGDARVEVGVCGPASFVAALRVEHA